MLFDSLFGGLHGAGEVLLSGLGQSVIYHPSGNGSLPAEVIWTQREQMIGESVMQQEAEIEVKIIHNANRPRICPKPGDWIELSIGTFAYHSTDQQTPSFTTAIFRRRDTRSINLTEVT